MPLVECTAGLNTEQTMQNSSRQDGQNHHLDIEHHDCCMNTDEMYSRAGGASLSNCHSNLADVRQAVCANETHAHLLQLAVSIHVQARKLAPELMANAAGEQTFEADNNILQSLSWFPHPGIVDITQHHGINPSAYQVSLVHCTALSLCFRWGLHTSHQLFELTGCRIATMFLWAKADKYPAHCPAWIVLWEGGGGGLLGTAQQHEGYHPLTVARAFGKLQVKETWTSWPKDGPADIDTMPKSTRAAACFTCASVSEQKRALQVMHMSILLLPFILKT